MEVKLSGKLLKGFPKVSMYVVLIFINTMFLACRQKASLVELQNDYMPTPKEELPIQYEGYRLIWNDEFDTDGALSDVWSFEQGFVRNEELQWYQKENATVTGGCLVIEARLEEVANPRYVPESGDWKENRNVANYTAGSLTTKGRFDFMYGRMEVRAKIPTAQGAWPAIWTLGNQWEWPLCGEIDVMEYYQRNEVPIILANACWGSEYKWVGVWDEATVPFSSFTEKDPEWVEKFHVWRMDWTPNFIRLYLDDELLNEVDLSLTANRGWEDNFENPFSNDVEGFGHYILLNLAVGGNGGMPDNRIFPLKYEVDYVRVYQIED